MSDPRDAEAGPVTLTLELEPDSDPITGRLSQPGAPAQRFVGWLGLAQALERVLDAGGPKPGV